MPREKIVGDSTSALTPAEITKAVQDESLRAARTGLTNAMTNAGMTPVPTPSATKFTPAVSATTSAPTGIATGTYLNPANDPMKNKAVKPVAPAGYHYTWIGGTTTGSWQMYKDAVGTTTVDANGNPITAVPGAGGTSTTGALGPTLASDTFKNTLALYFGAAEMSQPWVDTLYKSVSSFYKTGSTIDEALNLSLQDVRNNPAMKPFTDRFKGLYALQDRLQKGEAIQVPTIAEYFKAESGMGDVMRSAGLGDLATQDFLGNILGTGKSVAEVSNIIQDVFTTIDNAPKSLKDTLSQYFPGVDRTSLAKALLTGPEGAAALSKKVKQVSVLSAANTQGLNVSMGTAADIAAQGYDYNQALAGFGQVSRELPTYQKLQEMQSGQAVNSGFVQGELQNAVFGKDIQQQMAIEAAAQKETNRFRGQSGTYGSRTLASQQRAGQF